MSEPVCVVVGVGPGNGAAFGRRFVEAGYRVALLARSGDYLKGLATELGDSARAYVCDVTDAQSITSAFATIREELGPIDTVLYNAGVGAFGSIEEVTDEAFETAWRVNAMGAFLVARAVVSEMTAAGKGNFIITGATASLRGGARFAAFASAKAAQRNLAQSMARHLGPKGVHVALVIVDGVIDIPKTREWFKDKSSEFFLKPAAIAESVYQLTQQDSSAWTFELDLRPNVENW